MNWKQLNSAIAQMNEQQVLDALNVELSGKARWTITKRLHQRYCTLRASKEREIYRQVCAKAAADSLLRVAPNRDQMRTKLADWLEKEVADPSIEQKIVQDYRSKAPVE